MKYHQRYQRHTINTPTQWPTAPRHGDVMVTVVDGKVVRMTETVLKDTEIIAQEILDEARAKPRKK